MEMIELKALSTPLLSATAKSRLVVESAPVPSQQGILKSPSSSVKVTKKKVSFNGSRSNGLLHAVPIVDRQRKLKERLWRSHYRRIQKMDAAERKAAMENVIPYMDQIKNENYFTHRKWMLDDFATHEKKLWTLSELGAFDTDFENEIFQKILSTLYDDYDAALEDFRRVIFLLIPEAKIWIYAQVNQLSHSHADNELKFKADYNAVIQIVYE